MLSPKPWRLDAVLLLLATIFISLLAGSVLAGLLHRFAVAGFKQEDSLGMVILGSLSLDGAALLFGTIFLWYHQVTWREMLGWSKEKFSSLIAPILGTVVVILPVAFALQIVSGVLLQKMGYEPKEQEAVELFVNAHSAAKLIYLVFFATVLAPVAEEFFFRGTLYPFIKQLGFPKLALIGSSLLFALIHGSVAIILPLFVFALAQVWLYERTNCLIAPIISHSMFNLANTILMFVGGAISGPSGAHS